MNRVETTFTELARAGRKGFIPYFTAGYPTPESFDKVMDAVAGAADIIEIGIPFSDPVADGPIIQASSEAALRAGVRIPHILESVIRFRTRHQTPIVLMGYYNPVLHYGEERFVRDAVAAGVDGLIVPDLPPEHAGALIAQARTADLSTIFLAAPTSTDERLRAVAAASTGYVYFISRLGVTGVGQTPSQALEASIARLRAFTDLPIATGFGISEPEHVRGVCAYADAAIVGSALVRLMTERRDLPDLAGIVREACHRFQDATRG